MSNEVRDIPREAFWRTLGALTGQRRRRLPDGQHPLPPAPPAGHRPRRRAEPLMQRHERGAPHERGGPDYG